MDEENKKIPKVRVGDVWLPAHKIWNVVETINTATDLVERYNENRPEITTPVTEDVIAKVRERMREMELRTGGKGALKAAAAAAAAAMGEPDPTAASGQGSTSVDPAASGSGHGSTDMGTQAQDDKAIPREILADAAKQMLEAMPLEDAIHMLKQEYGDAIQVRDLVGLVGEDVYRAALVREAQDYLANMIGPDQVAFLWNDAGIIRPHGGLWTEKDIVDLTG